MDSKKFATSWRSGTGARNLADDHVGVRFLRYEFLGNMAATKHVDPIG